MTLYRSKTTAVSALLMGITSKHKGDFYCLNCLNFFKTKSTLQSHKKVCESKDFCIELPSEDIKVLELNQYQKSDLLCTYYIIYYL